MLVSRDGMIPITVIFDTNLINDIHMYKEGIF